MRSVRSGVLLRLRAVPRRRRTCVDIAEAFNFNIGNAIKYLWRAGLKGDAIEDLRKSAWYVQREIERAKR